MFYDDAQLIIAATYGRVSTFKQASQESISLDEQDHKMLNYADVNHISVPKEYRFREAISGLKDEREEYDKIRKLIRERKINALIVYSSDRYTRDPIHGKIFRAELKRSKATLHIVTEGGEIDIYSAQGELMATIKDAFNKYWLDKILEVTYEKKQEYLRRGVPFVQGHVRYGYKRVGKKLDAKAVIDEELKPIIQRMYDWAEEGLSIYQIDKLLTGTPAPGDLKKDKTRTRGYGSWGPMAVQRILRDEIYAGVYWANRQEVYEDKDGKKRKRDRPREEWIKIEVPAIIKREQWEKVQGILNRSSRERPRMHAKYEYLLSRRLTCGKCGYSGTSQPHPQEDGSLLFYYECSTNKTKSLAAPRCGIRKFRAPESDAAVWAKLKEVILNPQTFLARLRDMQERQHEETIGDEAELQHYDALMDEQNKLLTVARRKELRAEAEEDAGDLAFYKQEIADIKAVIANLQQQKERVQRRLARVRMSDAEIQSVQQLTEWAQPLLKLADNNFQWRRKLIEAYDWRFTLKWRDNQRLIVIHWLDWDLEVEVNHPKRRWKRKEGS